MRQEASGWEMFVAAWHNVQSFRPIGCLIKIWTAAIQLHSPICLQDLNPNHALPTNPFVRREINSSLAKVPKHTDSAFVDARATGMEGILCLGPKSGSHDEIRAQKMQVPFGSFNLWDNDHVPFSRLQQHGCLHQWRCASVRRIRHPALRRSLNGSKLQQIAVYSQQFSEQTGKWIHRFDYSKRVEPKQAAKIDSN